MPHRGPAVRAVPRRLEGLQVVQDPAHRPLVQGLADHDGGPACPRREHRPNLGGPDVLVAQGLSGSGAAGLRGCRGRGVDEGHGASLEWEETGREAEGVDEADTFGQSGGDRNILMPVYHICHLASV